MQIENLTKSFGDQPVLKDVSLRIIPGEFVVVVGQSGCGKSTLLRLIAGLEKATKGMIRLNGHPLYGLNPLARVMFQDSRLLPWRTVLNNVKLGLGKQGYGRSRWALEQVGLGDRTGDWIMQLSGGQQQRVALARALVSEPRLLLLDEPLGALDALTRFEMQQLIESLWQEQKFTAVLVTHDVEEAVLLGDRVVVIQDGQVELDLPIHLPRPRFPDTAGIPALRQKILNQILRRV
ncbi:ABC transporter ATP-binding protein [Synechococcus moorigangaii CMS01]|nr:ABC transporter ATP-binding protein [Synechococcus moorigangaii CMS01]